MKDSSSCNSEWNNKQMIAGKIIPAIISFAVLIFIDQITKFLIVKNMELYDSIPIISDVFEIHYIQNPGAAWGMLANQRILFIISTIFVLILGGVIYVRCLPFEKFRMFRALIILILSGAVGNLIDRIRLQYVIDFFYFKLINFPVFNVADCYVTIGFFFVIILVLFKYSDEDFDILVKSKKKS